MRSAMLLIAVWTLKWMIGCLLVLRLVYTLVLRAVMNKTFLLFRVGVIEVMLGWTPLAPHIVMFLGMDMVLYMLKVLFWAKLVNVTMLVAIVVTLCWALLALVLGMAMNLGMARFNLVLFLVSLVALLYLLGLAFLHLYLKLDCMHFYKNGNKNVLANW